MAKNAEMMVAEEVAGVVVLTIIVLTAFAKNNPASLNWFMFIGRFNQGTFQRN